MGVHICCSVRVSRSILRVVSPKVRVSPNRVWVCVLVCVWVCFCFLCEVFAALFIAIIFSLVWDLLELFGIALHLSFAFYVTIFCLFFMKYFPFFVSVSTSKNNRVFY